MRKFLIYSVLFVCIAQVQVNAQQDAQSSLYFFNPLNFNPAYAGSRGSLNVTAVNRAQWVGWEGAPRTQFLSVHAPIMKKHLGVGGNLSFDRVGARSNFTLMANVAYHLEFKHTDWKLSMGLSGGIQSSQYDFNGLQVIDPTDYNYTTSNQMSAPNFGTGVYAYSKNAYIGFSIPRLLQRSLDTLSNSYLQRHYFLAAGYVYHYNSVLDIKPSVLVKFTANAPITIDMNLSAHLYKQFWVGVMYRYRESVGVNLAYSPNDSWSFGYAYDFPVNHLRFNNWGSHEIYLAFDLRSKQAAFISPRYF
jgi:type IX secretion system PorP/SprF family membrane protein